VHKTVKFTQHHAHLRLHCHEHGDVSSPRLARSFPVHCRPASARRSYPIHWKPAHTRRNCAQYRPLSTLTGAWFMGCDLRPFKPSGFVAQPNSESARNSARPMSNDFCTTRPKIIILLGVWVILFHLDQLNVP
jgi:hypothetical protein